MLKTLRLVLSNKKYFFLFIAFTIIYGLIFAVLTNLIDMRFGLDSIKIAFTWVSFGFMLLLSLLSGLLLCLQVFAFRQRQKTASSASVGFTGAFLGFFTTTCPFCKPLLLSIIGFSGSLALLKYGLILAGLSVALLLIAVYLTVRSIETCKSCLPLTGKNCNGNTRKG